MICNWCGNQFSPTSKKRFCEKCASRCFKECSRCHRPFPEAKFFLDEKSKRCKACEKILKSARDKRLNSNCIKPTHSRKKKEPDMRMREDIDHRELVLPTEEGGEESAGEEAAAAAAAATTAAAAAAAEKEETSRLLEAMSKSLRRQQQQEEEEELEEEEVVLSDLKDGPVDLNSSTKRPPPSKRAPKRKAGVLDVSRDSDKPSINDQISIAEDSTVAAPFKVAKKGKKRTNSSVPNNQKLISEFLWSPEIVQKRLPFSLEKFKEDLTVFAFNHVMIPLFHSLDFFQ